MKSYTLDKLHEALDAVRRGDNAAAQGAILELIKRHELIMQTFEMKKVLEKELSDGQHG